MRCPTLKKRSQFVRVSKQGKVFHTAGFVLQVFSFSSPTETHDSRVFVGFTASKKVGNAVKRNRAKRRLRALIQKHWDRIQEKFSTPVHMVLVARSVTPRLPFTVLEHQLLETVASVGKS